MSITSSINRASSSSSKTLKSSQILKIIFGGNGLTRIEGCVTFVPFSAPGDEALLQITEKKKNYQIGVIKKLFKKGPGRTTPKCPHFGACGGCQLQHLSYDEQLNSKQGFIQEALRIDHVPITPSPEQWNYRSHLRLNLRKEKDGFKMGYIALDNTSLLEPTTCPLFREDPSFFADLKEGLKYLPSKGIHSASLRLFQSKQGIVLAFSFSPKLPEKLPLFPFAIGVAYKSPGKEKHFGYTTIINEILGITVPFSPYGFMQNNPSVAEKIYQKIVDWVGDKPKKVLDLYCGVGVTAALLSQAGHTVIGVEANKNQTSCSKDFKLIYGKVENILPKLLKVFQPDVILVNPPRTGLSKEILPFLKAPEILYLSCMPPTLARDLSKLKERYSLKSVEAFDMFPQTTHVETLVHLY